jgi:nicotinamidase-related amidase
MRLPVDAALILIGDVSEVPGVGQMVAAWAQERLPILRVDRDPFAAGDLEAALDEIGATTLVLSGEGEAAVATARGAAARGFRVFIVAEPPLAEVSADIARIVTPETAVAAALRARARERWNAAREAALLAGEELNSKR